MTNLPELIRRMEIHTRHVTPHATGRRVSWRFVAVIVVSALGLCAVWWLGR